MARKNDLDGNGPKLERRSVDRRRAKPAATAGNFHCAGHALTHIFATGLQLVTELPCFPPVGPKPQELKEPIVGKMLGGKWL